MPDHRIHLYLLGKLPVTRPDQLCAMDITCIWMARGVRHGFELVTAFAQFYLAVLLDRFTGRVFLWRVSITLQADFCIETLEEAPARYGKPEIFNMESGRAIGPSGQTPDQACFDQPL